MELPGDSLNIWSKNEFLECSLARSDRKKYYLKNVIMTKDYLRMIKLSITIFPFTCLGIYINFNIHFLMAIY